MPASDTQLSLFLWHLPCSSQRVDLTRHHPRPRDTSSNPTNLARPTLAASQTHPLTHHPLLPAHNPAPRAHSGDTVSHPGPPSGLARPHSLEPKVEPVGL